MKVLLADQSMDLAFQEEEMRASMHKKAKHVKDLTKILVMPSQSAMQDLNAEKLTK